MKRHKILYLDESGKADLTHPSPYYILSSCSIPEERIDELRANADKIIFKFWGSKRSFYQKYRERSIVFHAKDIFACNGPFSILNNTQIKKEFWNDMYGQIISQPYVSYYISITNKSKVRQIKTWGKQTTLRKSYQAVIESFIKHTIAHKATGEIVAESAYDQDAALVNILSSFQRNKYTYRLKSYKVGQVITSLSLVNKNDDEIGSQLADLVAWTGKNKYMIDNGLTTMSSLRREEKMLLDMFSRRLASKSSKDGFHTYTIIP